MKRIQELNKEINDMTLKIQQEHPELYKYLDENPITIANIEDPEMNIKNLTNWLDSLKQLLKYHVENHEYSNI